MTKIEREAIAFVEARRAELDARERSWLGVCEHRDEGDWETGDPGYHSCVMEDDVEPGGYCDPCRLAAVAYAEFLKLRPVRRNALRRLERAVKARG